MRLPISSSIRLSLLTFVDSPTLRLLASDPAVWSCRLSQKTVAALRRDNKEEMAWLARRYPRNS